MATQRRSFSCRLLCAIFFTPIFVVGIIFLILWLSLRPHHPKFHVKQFTLQGLGQTTGYLNVNVTVRNPSHRVRICYDSMRGSVYYKDQRVGVVSVFESHYQEPKNTTILHYVYNEPLTLTTQASNNQRTIEIMNDLIKYKGSMWDKRSHRMRATCNVGVGPNGVILAKYKDRQCHVHMS
ncbi:hypothetical protein CISIN_1g039458mg [Citrus sinensis]|uniref:Late embryogenesis abundant protein LEA-2 subgroup domain-containing protein n=1 Tax=Citrus sinensis TaxID=2711 RepID=A0A067GAB9_CITSI|nr:hypothetical protein CISIN_1g039458mg [Citrus sinensis]